MNSEAEAETRMVIIERRQRSCPMDNDQRMKTAIRHGREQKRDNATGGGQQSEQRVAEIRTSEQCQRRTEGVDGVQLR